MTATSEIVFETRTTADAMVVRATMFSGTNGRIVGIAAELLKRGHHLTAAESIPGLWHIDGGPELTTNQLLAVAHGMLSRSPA